MANPHAVAIVREVRVEAGELIGRAHRLVGDQSEQQEATYKLVPPPHAPASILRRTPGRRDARLAASSIPSGRRKRACSMRGRVASADFTESCSIDGNVSERRVLDAFRHARRLHESVGSGGIVRSDKEHGGADPLGFGGSQIRPEDVSGQGKKEPGTVSRVRASATIAPRCLTRHRASSEVSTMVLEDRPCWSATKAIPHASRSSPGLQRAMRWSFPAPPGKQKRPPAGAERLCSRSVRWPQTTGHAESCQRPRGPPVPGPRRFSPPKAPSAVTPCWKMRANRPTITNSQVCGEQTRSRERRREREVSPWRSPSGSKKR